METVTSADGTPIAVETTGTGHPVILIGGAFNDRSTVAALAATLAPQLTVLTYDRRGRGASGPIGPWTSEAADREIEAAILECGAHPLRLELRPPSDPGPRREGSPGSSPASRVRPLET